MPSPTRSTDLHPWTLGFRDPEQERAYWRAFVRDRLSPIRGILLVLLATLVAFGAIDALAFPDHVGTLAGIRFGFTIPAVLLAFPLAFAPGSPPFLERWIQEIILYLTVVVGITLTIFGWVLVDTAGVIEAYITALCLLYAELGMLGVSRLRFRYAAPIAVGAIGGPRRLPRRLPRGPRHRPDLDRPLRGRRRLGGARDLLRPRVLRAARLRERAGDRGGAGPGREARPEHPPRGDRASASPTSRGRWPSGSTT